MTRTFLSIILINICLSTMSQGILAGTPLYIARLGESALLSGSIITVYMVAIIVARILSGLIVDTFTRRITLILGSGLLMLGALILVFSDSITLMFVSRMFQGIGFATAHTAVSSATADVVPVERLGEGISYSTLGVALGMALGPSMAILLTSLSDIRMFSYGLAAIGFVSLVLSFTVRYEKNPTVLPPSAGYRRLANAGKAHKERGGSRLTVRSLAGRFFERSGLAGGIPMFFLAMSFTIFVSFTTMYANTLGYQNPALFYVLGALIALSLRLFASKLFDRVNLKKLFLIPVLAGMASLLLVLLVHHEMVFHLAGIGYGIGIGLSIPLLNSVTIKASSPQQFGGANALFFLLYDLGIGVASLVWAGVIDLSGYPLMYIGGCISLIITYTLSLKTFPK